MVFREAVAAGGAMVVSRVLNSLVAHSSLKLAEECYDTIQLRSIMSMLVHCTYFRDLHEVEETMAVIMKYHNERAEKYGYLHWEMYPCQVDERGLKDLGLAFYRRSRSHKNPNAPDLAIVLRGTILTRPLDLLADLRIGLERLNQSSRVFDTVRLILQVVKEFLRENPGGRICMAGHSLGAAIALIVGGTLYSTYEININTHLFNPPLVTAVDFLTGQALPRPTAPADFDGVDHVPKLEVNFVQLKEVFVQVYGNQAAMEDEWAKFQKLRNWVPHFYLNPGDLFCHLYIKFYKQESAGNVISPQGVITSHFSNLFKRNVTYFRNVVPSADLHISTWKRNDLRLAHSLRQWHKYKPEYIQLEPVYHARLLHRSPPEPLPEPLPRRQLRDY